MAGVWPWMEGRRLACGLHLRKLVVVGDEGTRSGHQALCGLSPLLGAGQARQFGQGEDVGGSTRPRWKQGGQCLAGRTGFYPPLNTRDLGYGPWEGQGKPGACSQLWRGLVPDLADSGQHQTGRSGHKLPLYYSCQGKTRPCRSERLGTDRALVKDTLSRMALGPGGRAGKALARELPAT